MGTFISSFLIGRAKARSMKIKENTIALRALKISFNLKSFTPSL